MPYIIISCAEADEWYSRMDVEGCCLRQPDSVAPTHVKHRSPIFLSSLLPVGGKTRRSMRRRRNRTRRKMRKRAKAIRARKQGREKPEEDEMEERTRHKIENAAAWSGEQRNRKKGRRNSTGRKGKNEKLGGVQDRRVQNRVPVLRLMEKEGIERRKLTRESLERLQVKDLCHNNERLSFYRRCLAINLALFVQLRTKQMHRSILL